MPRTIQCPKCGVVLNLPEGATGRRLRCPHCQNKFSTEDPDSKPPSSVPGVGVAGPASSTLSTSMPGDVLPTAAGDLRETFDLPLMMGSDSSPKGKTADAVALFQDTSSPPRRQTAGDARSKARRCPTCGGVVPPGMSICAYCGLDLETGVRVGFDEDLDVAPATARGPSLPIAIAILGAISLLGSAILMLVAFTQWMRNQEGYEFLALVCAFGVYASVQFLRAKSSKLLVIALSLGALIDIVALIALPIYEANAEAPVVVAPHGPGAEDEDQPPAIQPYVQRLNMNKITWGIALLLIYAVLVLYLNSPPVRRFISKQ